MQKPQHGILSADTAMSPQRMAGIGFALLLNVIVVWALVSGLAMRFVRYVPPALRIDLIATVDKPQPAPKKPTLIVPKSTDTILAPKIDYAPDRTSPINASPPQSSHPTQTVPDSAASGITSTHAIPPYPALARRLGEQGRVRLHLAVAADGTVSKAQIVGSSGFADLDQSALDWVVAHWRYRPAVQNGVAVAGTADAAVIFNLKDAR